VVASSAWDNVIRLWDTSTELAYSSFRIPTTLTRLSMVSRGVPTDNGWPAEPICTECRCGMCDAFSPLVESWAADLDPSHGVESRWCAVGRRGR